MNHTSPTTKRVNQAIDFIISSCGSVGAFHGTMEPHAFIEQTASEMAATKPSNLFPGRYIEHVAYALELVVKNMFTSPPAAVASVYLVTRFEYYFRILSGKLNADGTWVSPSARNAAKARIDNGRVTQNHVFSVGLAYKIMKLDDSISFVQHCKRIDDALYSTPTTVAGGVKVHDLGDRIKFGRDTIAPRALGRYLCRGRVLRIVDCPGIL